MHRIKLHHSTADQIFHFFNRVSLSVFAMLSLTLEFFHSSQQNAHTHALALVSASVTYSGGASSNSIAFWNNIFGSNIGASSRGIHHNFMVIKCIGACDRLRRRGHLKRTTSPSLSHSSFTKQRWRRGNHCFSSDTTNSNIVNAYSVSLRSCHTCVLCHGWRVPLCWCLSLWVRFHSSVFVPFRMYDYFMFH